MWIKSILSEHDDCEMLSESRLNPAKSVSTENRWTILRVRRSFPQLRKYLNKERTENTE